MKRGRKREVFEEHLTTFIPNLLTDDNILDEVSTHLYDVYGVDRGSLMYALNEYNILKDQDIAFLALLAEQISVKIPNATALKLDEWFSEHEIKNIRKYVHVDETREDEITLPFVFEDAMDLGDGVYAVAVDNSVIARLRKYHVIKYNFDIQREAKIIRLGNENKRVMNVNRKNIEEMTELILENKLKKTALAYNCTPDSTDDESGFEMIYDKKTKTLTITEGTEINILDGTHRTNAFYEAYKRNSNITGKTVIHFSNYTTKQAQDFQVQLSKQTPIPKSRIEQLEDATLSTTLVTRLNSEGMLKDKIGVDGRYRNGTFVVLSSDLIQAFELIWKPQKPKDVNKIKELFNEYLEELFEYQDESEENLLFDYKVFSGHVALARKMHELEIPFEEVGDIIDKVTDKDIEKLGKIRAKLGRYNYSKRDYADLASFFENLIKK